MRSQIHISWWGTQKEVSSYTNAAAETGLTDIDRRCEEAHLNPKYIFDTFIVGNNNKFAQAAALAVAESPGDTYNPLFIYGGAGLVKPILCIPSLIILLSTMKTAKFLYVTSEEFTNELIETIRKRKQLSNVQNSVKNNTNNR